MATFLFFTLFFVLLLAAISAHLNPYLSTSIRLCILCLILPHHYTLSINTGKEGQLILINENYRNNSLFSRGTYIEHPLLQAHRHAADPVIQESHLQRPLDQGDRPLPGDDRLDYRQDISGG